MKRGAQLKVFALIISLVIQIDFYFQIFFAMIECYKLKLIETGCKKIPAKSRHFSCSRIPDLSGARITVLVEETIKKCKIKICWWHDTVYGYFTISFRHVTIYGYWLCDNTWLCYISVNGCVTICGHVNMQPLQHFLTWLYHVNSYVQTLALFHKTKIPNIRNYS